MELKIDDLLKDDTIVSICQVLKTIGITQYQTFDDGYLIIHNGKLYRFKIKEDKDNGKKKTS